MDDDNGTPLVRTYEGDPVDGFQLSREHRDKVMCSMPFEVSLDLSPEVFGI